MDVIKDFIKKQSVLLMSIFIVNQCILYVLFLALFIYYTNITSVYHSIYLCTVLGILMVFMVYFALQTVSRAYFVELFAFLTMSTISSAILLYNFFVYVILNPNTHKLFSTVLGSLAILLLAIGTLVYFLCAYYSYGYFEEVCMRRCGANAVHHEIYYWIQFNDSMFELELGFSLVLLLSLFVFEEVSVWFIVFDCLLGLITVTSMVFMKIALREENSKKVKFIITAKVLSDLYELYRYVSILILNLPSDTNFKSFLQEYKLGYVILFTCFIVHVITNMLIIVSSLKCLSNFGQGLKDSLLKQTKINSNERESLYSEF